MPSELPIWTVVGQFKLTRALGAGDEFVQPGREQPPGGQVKFWNILDEVGATPPSVKLIGPPSAFLIASIETCAWGSAIGCPAGLRRIPGRSRIIGTASLAISLSMGLCAPMLIKVTRSSRAFAIASWRAPAPMASRETKTPTAQATPMTIVAKSAQRCGRVVMLMRTRPATCLK